ncbi:hypothetical protein [Stenomitos frigidus]|uniref:hypothetical protein n=1 Tax=Stenomitos frigidus TaxID=1886765 RepID=UPI0011B2918D|nr:hypothetical protein [Stenomitos frigidus]
MVALYVARWSLEVTVEAARAARGVPSQRHWSKAPTTRTTPVLLALFSLSCLLPLPHPTRPSHHRLVCQKRTHLR